MENENRPNVPEVITEEDFTFVQKDETLYDKKFQTRPTTFFKDAMKRFVKNKSSVVASAILAILIMMAIVVPIADRNDISHNNIESQYLPPKWFSGDNNGFMDGTKWVDHVVLDPHNRDAQGNYLLPEDSSYVQNAIIGGITGTTSYANDMSGGVRKYGKNGDITVSNVGTTDRASQEWTVDGPAGLLSPEVTFTAAETVSYGIRINYEATKASLLENSELAMILVFIPEGAEPVNLTSYVNFSESVDELRCDDVVSMLPDADNFTGRFGIFTNVPTEIKYTQEVLYVTSAEAEASVSDISVASFNNATKALSELEDGLPEAYTRYGTAKLGIHGSEILYGSFRYDYYKAIFGSTDDNDPKPVFRTMSFSGYDIDDFTARGWMTYQWGSGTTLGQFELTEAGKTYCPIREILTQNHREDPFHPGDPAYEIREVTAKTSYYRLLHYKGYIAECNPPKYIFGTDKNGLDFFKVVFSGLLVSLGLGLLSAAINIVIGLIWGAIAGYFGGWTDLLMERFVEILGGMPWIVMMTLIVLLTGSNSFGIFLLALCITGWIGISGVTRSQFYRYKRREYVLASRTLGASDGRLIFRHILPNAIGTIVTSAVLMIPSVIFTEANIAYLLPGTMQLSGSFGVTLSNVQGDLSLYPYLIVSASIVMALIMISFNLFGNGLRDAFNPSLKGSDE